MWVMWLVDVDFDDVDDVAVVVIVDDVGDAEQSQSAPLQYLASPSSCSCQCVYVGLVVPLCCSTR